MIDQQSTRTATVTTPAEREIHIERIFDAPRDRVFAVYTDPALIPEWWGPRGTTTVVDKMDVRTGGDWRFLSQRLRRRRDGLSRHVPRGQRPRPHRADLRVGGHARLHLPSRRATFEDLGDRTKVTHDVALPHDRGARRHARLGHGGRDERDLPAPRRAARAAGEGLTSRSPARIDARRPGTSGGPPLV